MRALWLRFLDWLSTRFGIARTPVPREPVSLRPIGVVRNAVRQPRPDGWERLRSDIIVREELLDGLAGIDGYSHLIVVFAFHRVPDSEQRLQVRPYRGAPADQGVFATRSQLRPNPIGVSVVRLVRRRRNVIWVEGLDAVDGTPVLDIKPYFANHDAVPDARVPAWWDEAADANR